MKEVVTINGRQEILVRAEDMPDEDRRIKEIIEDFGKISADRVKMFDDYEAGIIYEGEEEKRAQEAIHRWMELDIIKLHGENWRANCVIPATYNQACSLLEEDLAYIKRLDAESEINSVKRIKMIDDYENGVIYENEFLRTKQKKIYEDLDKTMTMIFGQNWEKEIENLPDTKEEPLQNLYKFSNKKGEAKE